MSEDQSLLNAFTQADSNEPITQAAEPSPEATPEPAAPQSATPSEPPSKWTPPSDDTPIELTVGGQVVTKTWKELLQTQGLLPADYTRKTQALAQERKTFISEREQFDQLRNQFEQERAALAQALKDPRKIEALYLAAVAAANGQAVPNGQAAQVQPNGQAPQVQQPPFDPNAIFQGVNELVNQRFAELEQARVNAERGSLLERHVDAILTANPVLKAIPNVNNYLYEQVMSMVVPGQTTVEEAQGYLDTVAQAVATSLNSHYTQTKKVDAVAESQLKNGIEPRGGSPVLPQAKKYDRKKGLDDPELEADVLAYLKGQLGT